MWRIYIFIYLISTCLSANSQTINGSISLTDGAFNSYFQHTSIPSVQGKIENATPEELAALNISYTLVTPFFEFQSQRNTQVNNNGSFSLVLDYPFPYQQVWLSIGEYYYAGLYINKELTIEIDFSKLKKKHVNFIGNGIKYCGDDGALNEWMNKQILFKEEIQQSIVNSINLLNPNDAKYFKKLDSLYAEQKDLDREFVRKNPTSYAWLLENEHLSDYFGHILMASITKRSEPKDWKKIQTHRTYLVSNASSIFYTKLYEYFKVVKSNINFNRYNIHDEIQKLDSAFKRPYADVLKLKIHDDDVHEYKQVLDVLLKTTKTPWCKMVIEKQYQVSTDRLNQVNSLLLSAKSLSADSTIGQPVALLSFGASLSVVNAMEPQEFLNKLKNMFKGKAIILDFWATWCVPCLEEMPFGHKLYDDTSGLPVKFIYICTSNNSTVDKWKNKIAELKQPGIHLFVDEILAEKTMALLGKSGFPSYVCLNQSGQIVPGIIKRMSLAGIDDIRKLIRE